MKAKLARATDEAASLKDELSQTKQKLSKVSCGIQRCSAFNVPVKENKVIRESCCI